MDAADVDADLDAVLLTEEQVATLTEWIRQGAEYEPHWAFVAPVKPPVPEVKEKSWPRTAGRGSGWARQAPGRQRAPPRG